MFRPVINRGKPKIQPSFPVMQMPGIHIRFPQLKIHVPLGTGNYMGETYKERLDAITDPNARSAFQAAYAKKMAGSTDYISSISKAYNTGTPGAANYEDALDLRPF